ncbi:helix-turn-helix transcriptional regulator [Sphingobium vermicomposti]|uniref:DNA-binding CsgD family transcriptional regulator/PAS domain-containing protein n=1 Tax=Sphingobium vermicomposti TaxID=529005 RepID=A0A846MDH8_9SPHN|nr:LuxR family transcriptional regulator [Sphingobium vermicomposti]NIJ18214.1 DNA-binding CsgD family transcriptional regulator/PAS domain-containing protein [Sphingobium vermicomposti]
MSSVFATQRELLLPLVEGIHESPPWGGFLRQLVARTYARRAFLIITLANAAPDQEPAVVHVAAPRAATEPPLDFRRIERLGLHPYGALRPGRVYSLEEMLDYDRPAQRDRQRAELDEMNIRYGRFLRVSAGGAADAWLLLVREREDFTASAVAALSGVGPHLSAALKTLAALIEQRLQVALAQSALQRLGVGQLAFDATGRVMAADRQAEALLSFVPDPDPTAGRRLQLLPAVSQALEAACAELAAAPPGASLPLPLGTQAGLWMLLRKADLPLAEPCAFPAATGVLRIHQREDALRARRALSAIYGLSMNEAALAHQLSMGETIVEAGQNLRLTPETSRSYSKRIYAKTGTSSQADLVRLVLTGLAPFA